MKLRWQKKSSASELDSPNFESNDNQLVNLCCLNKVFTLKSDDNKPYILYL